MGKISEYTRNEWKRSFNSRLAFLGFSFTCLNQTSKNIDFVKDPRKFSNFENLLRNFKNLNFKSFQKKKNVFNERLFFVARMSYLLRKEEGEEMWVSLGTSGNQLFKQLKLSTQTFKHSFQYFLQFKKSHLYSVCFFSFFFCFFSSKQILFTLKKNS